MLHTSILLNTRLSLYSVSNLLRRKETWTLPTLREGLGELFVEDHFVKMQCQSCSGVSFI